MAYYNDKQLQEIRKGLKWAKANPDDPQAKKIEERILSGKMNFELKALGLKPVEVKKPKVDMSKAMAGQQPGLQSEVTQASSTERAIKDIPDDFMQMGKNIREGFQRRTKETGENIARRKETQKGALGELGETIGTGLDFASDTLMTAIDAVEQGGMFAVKSFLTPEAEQATEETLTNILGTTIENAQTNPATAPIVDQTQKLVASYQKWAEENPEKANAIEDTGKIVLALAEVMGAKTGITVGKESIDAATDVVRKTAPKVGQGLEKGQQTLEKAARVTGEAVDTFAEARKPARVAAQQEKVNEAVSRITQAGADTRAISQAKRALSEIDTTDVKTYTDLNTRIGDKIEALSKSVDDELSQYTEVYKPETLGKYTKVGGKTVVENPVQDALDGLETAYIKSGEVPKAEAVKQLREKLNSQGLTVSELNQVAREYGIEFKDRAFNKMGEAKAGYNAENYENVRKGVKDVLRERLPDDVTKELDSKISDLYSTRNLTEKIEDKIAKLHQRIKNRTLAQKVGGAAADIADLLSFGTLRGFVGRILPSNVGNKAMNSIEIEAELRKNLKQIDKLLEMKDDKKFADAFENYMKEAKGGLSIKSTVTPVSVAKKMDDEDFNRITRIIEEGPDMARLDPDTNAFLKQLGLDKAEPEELNRFLIETTDEYEQLKGSFNQPAD